MSNQSLSELRAELLNLPEEERAKLALELASSLDGPQETGATEAWDEEILRRLAEIDAGTVELIDREEFKRRIRDRMSNA